MVGRERLGVARELLDAEHFCPQRRLVRASARACQPGHPFLKAQWQWLHVLGNNYSTFVRMKMTKKTSLHCRAGAKSFSVTAS
jgi:hypothetical protein